jgi:epoxyqueuosine reductase
MADLARTADPGVRRDAAELSARIKQWCREAGFDLAGIAPATPGLGGERLIDWLDAGRHGEMAFMARGRNARLDPGLVLAGARSVLAVALAYRTVEPAPAGPEQGRISRYAWGRDYHHVVRERLRRVAARLRRAAPDVRTRIAVDSAPVMERDYAQLAGLGWIGKNTLLLNRGLGSWFFLGVMLLDCELEYDAPARTDHCGSCRRCLDACPTRAFDGPYQLDPRRCISYLTIEHKSDLPEEAPGLTGEWVFGCDVCQEVCPWNDHAAKRAGEPPEEEFQPLPGANPVSLATLLATSPEEFERRFRSTPLYRTGRDRVVRNAILAARRSDLPELWEAVRRLTADASPLVRKAARRALEGRDCPDRSANRRIPTANQDA